MIIRALLQTAVMMDAFSNGANPQTIVGGSESEICQFPSTVVIQEDDETPTMCSGTLVHPEIVVTAAHCITTERPIVAVGFGETGTLDQPSTRRVTTTECVAHPDFDGDNDIGFCRLSEPVYDVPIVPIASPCDEQAIDVGTEVVIVGFGVTFADITEEGEIGHTEGVGTKRWTTQTIVEIDDESYAMSAFVPNQSACFGDSGGSSYVRMPDGTWRVFGNARELYTPDGVEQPDPETGNYCGAGVIYTRISPYLEWLESESGFDLSPCWDDNTWIGCDVPLQPNVAFGSWDEGCQGGSVATAEEPVCELMAGTSSGDPWTASSTGHTGDDSDSDSDETTSASTGVTHDSTGNVDGGSTSMTEPLMAASGDSSGCGCHSGAAPLSPLCAVFTGLLGIRRRRA